jgi:hypothetical protein
MIERRAKRRLNEAAVLIVEKTDFLVRELHVRGS